MNNKKNILNIISNVGDLSQKMVGNIKMNSDIVKMRNRQEEHKYNIGKMILEKNVKVNDKLINSNLKTIKDIING